MKAICFARGSRTRSKLRSWAAPLPAPMLASAAKRYGLRTLPLRTGIHEELFVVTAERQFAHEGVRILARVAGAPVGKGVPKRVH